MLPITYYTLFGPNVSNTIIFQLWSRRESMAAQEASLAPWLEDVDPSYRASVGNLTYYLAPRHSGRRPFQERPDHIGASSLGHAKSNVLANVDKVLVIVRQLTGDGRET
jgi:hypothetical protein